MTNYGLPFNFKSVNTETGEEVMLKHDFYADYYWEGAGEKDKVYQSIGLHMPDELFFGDVVLYPDSYRDGSKLFIIQKSQGHYFGPVLRDYYATSDDLDEKEIHFDYPIQCEHDLIVIGNIHHSREELERRAQEVRA